MVDILLYSLQEKIQLIMIQGKYSRLKEYKKGKRKVQYNQYSNIWITVREEEMLH